MKNSKSIEPKNLTAQLHYRGEGNPPTSHPGAAISNSFPGLEADFRNVWTHIFEGIVLHEASNLVVAVEATADEKIQQLVNQNVHYFLVEAHRKSMVAPVKGPSNRPGVPINAVMALEWSNALAEIVPLAGRLVTCKFESTDNRRKPIRVKLRVRHFFDADTNRQGNPVNQRVVISRDMADPGELTQSLCSPWQNDYRDCACFYWAASRPDYVNVEPGKDGKSAGNNWLEKDRTKASRKSYITDTADNRAKQHRLISYQDLFTSWEESLRFIIGGKDEILHKDGKPRRPKKRKSSGK
jgi:hypothetical protein